MKNIIAIIILNLFIQIGFSQSNAPVKVNGDINISYLTKQFPDKKGTNDVYHFNINVDNSVVFIGNIYDYPQIVEGTFSKSVTQNRKLKYDMALGVVNPRNAQDVRMVGKMLGTVPISQEGVYNFNNLSVDVLPIGRSGGFTSKFSGNANGKPLNRPSDWLDKLKKEAIPIVRMINGKADITVLNKYDKMEFRQHIIAAGPAQIYQPVTVNGDLFYDYDKSAWYWNNVTVQFTDVSGTVKSDRVSGVIRWIESPKRATDGQGRYEFDLRYNEPLANGNEVFQGGKRADESSFFEVDNSVASLTGTMVYQDVIRNGVTLASKVKVDLVGNSLPKPNVMAIVKLIMFSCVVPMNSD